MPSARVLPKKYLGTLEQTQEELRLIAQKCKRAIIEIEAKQASHHLHSLLREVESTSYRLAFELSQLQIAGSCDGCPSAPPTTIAQAHLLVLADELERHAELARVQIARALSEYLGHTISEAMLNEWSWEGSGDHRIPLDAFIALVHATGAKELLGFAPGEFGLTVIASEYAEMIEERLLDDHIEEMQARKQVMAARRKARR